jgi:hypothetical protein
LRARPRFLALLVATLFAVGAESDPEDPPLCREALARHPEASALEALAEEEKRLAVEARGLRREARRVMRQTLGAGAAARAQLPAYEALSRRESEAKRAGKTLCYCRQRRGDPHREDCELLYPAVIP